MTMGTGSTVPSRRRVDGAACPRAKLLLVNADDFGFSRDMRTDGTLPLRRALARAAERPLCPHVRSGRHRDSGKSVAVSHVARVY